MSDNLRSELEAAHRAYREALSSKDAEALLAAAILPPFLPREEFLPRFDDFAEYELASGPELADRQFVALKTLGEDLAGYYALWRPDDEPEAACVAVTVFRRTPDGWKVMIGGGTVTFTPQPGEDVQARALDIVESDEDMQLRPMDDDPPPGGAPLPVEAALECMAYDCELSIVINGAQLKFAGGKSCAQRLQGVREGASPQEPNVLRMGRNDIVVTYRRTADSPPATIEVHLQSGPCLRMHATRSEGRLSGSFVIAPDGSPSDEVSCIEITDGDDEDSTFSLRTVDTTDPRFAFSMDVPAEWAQPDLPEDAADSATSEGFRPVAVFMAPYGAVVATLSVRPAPTTGTVAELLTRLSLGDQVVLDEIGPAQAGDIDGVGALGTQESQLGQMTLWVVMFERGGWAYSLLAMAPSAVWDSLRETFEQMFASFSLAHPQPATIPAWPSDDPMEES